MPQEPSRFIRPLAIVGFLLLMIGGGAAFFVAGQRTQQQVAQRQAQERAATPASDAAPAPAAATPTLTPTPTPVPTPGLSASPSPAPDAPVAATPTAPAPTSSPDSNAPPASATPPVSAPVSSPVSAPVASTVDVSGWRAQVWPASDLSTAQIASSHLKATFSAVGAGLGSLVLEDHFETIRRERKVVVQEEHRVPQYDSLGRPLTTADGTPLAQVVAPLAALGVEVNGRFINLSVDAAGTLWRLTPPATFEAHVLDESGNTALRVTRRYSLEPESRNVLVEQRIDNVSGKALDVRWIQMGPIDLPRDPVSYIGEKRRLRFGYILSPAYDPTQSFVLSDDFLIDHASALGPFDALKGYAPELVKWPNVTSRENGYTLSWIGLTNRYFGVSLHPPVRTPDPRPEQKRLSTVETVDRLVLLRPLDAEGRRNDVLALRLFSPRVSMAAGTSLDLSQSLYAGALIRREITSDTAGAALGMRGLVVYTMGGPCAFCTFGFLTSGLLRLMLFLHDYVAFDWALAIALLVVIVRTLLHPVTKWSQIRMQRFGKQMQEMAPKQQKLKEKFGHDAKLLQAETAKLWREEGISPLGMLGCFPMFLQMPIWIALYAMLFFAAELRHQPALFGIFQTLGHPTFLADLSEADGFYRFTTSGDGIHIPLLSALIGPVTGLNILPLILGIVFYMHQKYLTPPSSVQLTPEQELQQKMVKWMSLILFPLFMYNAPAGLTVYFLVNSALGIVEHKRIRKHIDKHDLLNIDKIKAARTQKSPGFFSRLQQIAEQQRALAEQAAKKKR